MKEAIGLNDFYTEIKKFNGGDKMEEGKGNGLEDISKIEMSKEEAEKLFHAYEEAIASRGKAEKYLKQLQEAYGFLKEGKVIIDIWDAFEKTGIGEDELPRLAISRADRKEVYLTGSRNFGHKSDRAWQGTEADVVIPTEITKNWKSLKNGKTYKTKVPIVPAQFLPKEDLSKYFVLWEVANWEEVSAPPKRKDPFLLKRISKNLFAVIAAWELTELEAGLIRGR